MWEKIYDKLLYAYLYVEITFWAYVDDFNDFRSNVRWIEKNGVYKGKGEDPS